jgi:hypothetical protein
MRPLLNGGTLGGRVMLLLDDDDELPIAPDRDETELATRLGSQGLQAVDAALVGHAQHNWLKVARVVLDALRSGGFPVEDDATCVHVRRISELVRAGVLEAQGNRGVLASARCVFHRDDDIWHVVNSWT